MARAQARLARSTFEEEFPENHAPEKLPLPVQESPPFVRYPTVPNHEWHRQTFRWSVSAAVVSVSAPVAIGIGLGHSIVGVVVGAVALLAVSLLAFGFYVLDNILPF